MKKIILTIDYELHFGKKTGNVKDCMIEPTNSLINLCEEYGCNMTVFWDILHYFMLLKFEKTNKQVLKDRIEIEMQIKDLILKGHDVQMHIHPHWLDAKIIDSKWVFDYDRFSLNKLSKSDDINDINTILGCVKLSKELMEKLIRETDPNYKVRVFRAGGYLIEPFNELSIALDQNEVFIDSSVCPNMKNDNAGFSYNFEGYPNLLEYKFKHSPSKIDYSGKFTEIPIKTIYISQLRNIFFILLRKIKYAKLENNRKGIGAGYTTRKSYKQRIWKKTNKILKPTYNQLTSDSSFREKYNYLLRKSDNLAVQILHPKLLNDHMLQVMKDNLSGKKVHFISINDYLLEKN